MGSSLLLQIIYISVKPSIDDTLASENLEI